MANRIIRKIYGILLSAAIGIAGICLIAGCITIYRSGDGFSRKAVALTFSIYAVPVYTCLALTVGSFLLDLFFPAQSGRKPIEKQDALILERLEKTTDLQNCDAGLYQKITAEAASRRMHKSISTALLLIASAVFFSFALNIDNFPKEQINEAMIRMMYLLLPCLGIPFGYTVFTVYYARKSIRRQIALIKTARGNGCPKISAADNQSHCPNKAVRYVRLCLLAIFAGMLIFGFIAGGTTDVLAKAANICTECVGLG